jgi:hypothetical protein
MLHPPAHRPISPKSKIHRHGLAVIAGLWLVSWLPNWISIASGQPNDAVNAELDSSPVASADLLGAEEEAFRAAVQNIAQSVVQIETFGGLERVGDELVAEGPTTGTIVDPDGWIISTLYSFRQQPASILVSLPDGQRVPRPHRCPRLQS